MIEPRSVHRVEHLVSDISIAVDHIRALCQEFTHQSAEMLSALDTLPPELLAKRNAHQLRLGGCRRVGRTRSRADFRTGTVLRPGPPRGVTRAGPETDSGRGGRRAVRRVSACFRAGLHEQRESCRPAGIPRPAPRNARTPPPCLLCKHGSAAPLTELDKVGPHRPGHVLRQGGHVQRAFESLDRCVVTSGVCKPACAGGPDPGHARTQLELTCRKQDLRPAATEDLPSDPVRPHPW